MTICDVTCRDFLFQLPAVQMCFLSSFRPSTTTLRLFLWLRMHSLSVIRVKDKDRVAVIARKMGYHSFQWKAWPGHLSLDYPWRTGDQNWAGGLLIWVVTMSDYLTCWSFSMCNCQFNQVHCIAITTFSREECPGQISLDHPWWWGGKFSFKVKLFVKIYS